MKIIETLDFLLSELRGTSDLCTIPLKNVFFKVHSRGQTIHAQNPPETKQRMIDVSDIETFFISYHVNNHGHPIVQARVIRIIFSLARYHIKNPEI
jgi:hypothetical protein